MHDLKRRLLGGLVLCTTLSILAACTSRTTETTPADSITPRRGGTIRYATIGEPATLDMMLNTNTNMTTITSNIYESLFALDSHLEPQPGLAQSYEIKDQGLRWVIELRKGVVFHNGQEMKSGDVLASLDRWIKVSSPGKILFNNLVSLEAPDNYSIVIHLRKPMPVLSHLLAIQDLAVIYPKAVIDATGDGKLQQYIGTGPYKFASWKSNQYIELTRFDQFQSRTEAADGTAGKREAYADSIRFIPVPEVQQRVQGVLTNLYDIADDISPDLYASIAGTPSIDPVILKPYSFAAFVFNKKQGIFSDLKMRQAVQAAADFQPMMQAAFGDSGFYRVDPGLFFMETKWWSDAGKTLYEQNNLARARQLLLEEGYRGQTIRVMTTHQYEYMYKLAVVLKSQLEVVGMHVALEVVDWATLIQRRKDPGNYDIFTTGFPLISEPVDAVFWDASWPGWWINSRKDSLVQELAMEPDEKKRLDIVSQLQELWYDDVPILKVGDFFGLWIKRRNVHSSGLVSLPRYLFNTWLSK